MPKGLGSQHDVYIYFSSAQVNITVPWFFLAYFQADVYSDLLSSFHMVQQFLFARQRPSHKKQVSLCDACAANHPPPRRFCESWPSWMRGKRGQAQESFGCGPRQQRPPELLITFLVGKPYKPSFTTVAAEMATPKESYTKWCKKKGGSLFPQKLPGLSWITNIQIGNSQPIRIHRKTTHITQMGYPAFF